MAADVVGFSRLLGRDEAGTLARLDACRRDIVDPAIAAHRGRIVKLIGDGVMVEFPTAVESVAAALAIQTKLARQKADASDAERIRYRIGISLGDIVIQPDGEIYGGSINIAARLQSLADPGGIVIAGNVREQLHGKLDVALEPMPHQRLKNIEHPVEVWRVQPGAAVASRRVLLRLYPKAIAFVAAALVMAIGTIVLHDMRNQPPSVPPVNVADSAQRLSIIVLPFNNISADPDQDYFADAITEDLTTQLSGIPNSIVIARSTAFAYRGRTINIRALGQDLNVRYAVEGSVRRLGDHVRVSAKLIDAGAGTQLWAETFDYERRDLPQLQDTITGRIARALGVEISLSEDQRIVRTSGGNMEAQDHLMRARAALYRNYPNGDWVAVRRLFEQALALDGRLAGAWAGVAFSYFFEFLAEQGNPETLHRAAEATERALAIAPREPWALRMRGNLLNLARRPQDALVAFELALATNRNDPSTLAGLGQSLALLGRPDEAVDYLRQSIRISPHDPLISLFEWQIGTTEISRGQHADAVGWLRRAMLGDPRRLRTRLLLAGALMLAGDEGAAMAEMAEFLRENPGMTLRLFRDAERSTVPAYLQQRQPLYDALRRAGLPEE